MRPGMFFDTCLDSPSGEESNEKHPAPDSCDKFCPCVTWKYLSPDSQVHVVNMGTT